VPEISLVIPVYNEEESLPILADHLDAFLSTWSRSTVRTPRS
jgi:glycosyltransferase involved in cell wall biosynthesis